MNQKSLKSVFTFRNYSINILFIIAFGLSVLYQGITGMNEIASGQEYFISGAFRLVSIPLLCFLAFIGFRWLKLKSSIHPSGEIVPYLLNINLSYNPAFVKDPSTYHLAELGIVCASYGKSKGLIIRVCPNLGKLVQVFQVTYENIDRIQHIVKETIDSLEKAEQKEDLLSLPPCPTFMNDGGKCPLMQECHSEEGSGCTS